VNAAPGVLPSPLLRRPVPHGVKAADKEEGEEDDRASPKGGHDVDPALLDSVVQRRRYGFGKGQLEKTKEF
jgi:hypothetical protein